jgi:hypothetical protein
MAGYHLMLYAARTMVNQLTQEAEAVLKPTQVLYRTIASTANIRPVLFPAGT